MSHLTQLEKKSTKKCGMEMAIQALIKRERLCKKSLLISKHQLIIHNFHLITIMITFQQRIISLCNVKVYAKLESAMKCLFYR